MICACSELLAILPQWLRPHAEPLCKDDLQEIRLRIGQHVRLVCKKGTRFAPRTVTQDDISYTVNTASRYSPWAAATSAMGYITAPGGHRIGLCGEAVMQNGLMTGIRTVNSLCIRVARDFPGIADKLPVRSGSVVLLGPPGSGKTTMLRDLIRQRSAYGSVAVVDERSELFPRGGVFSTGENADVLSGCSKAIGIENVLRSMGPVTVAVDEITSQEDAASLLHACHCGVYLLATAHAGNLLDFRSRTAYEPLSKAAVFDTAVIFRRDQSF